VAQWRELHMVQGQVKEERLAGNWSVLWREGSQGELLARWKENKLVWSFS